MKKLLAACTLVISGLFGSVAHADIVTTLHLDFASGAQYNGTVTFADGYAGMLDTNGTLTGGPYGSIHFGWTWWAGTAQTNPQDYDGDASTYEDILMTTDGPGWDNYIGLSWFHGAPGDAPVLNLSPLDFPSVNYWNSVASTGDLIVSGGFDNQVPEPASLALVGLALVAVVGARRRKA